MAAFRWRTWLVAIVAAALVPGLPLSPVEVVTSFTGTSTWDSITGVATQGLTKY